MDFMVRLFNVGQGEELKKAIGAAVYIECSSKTQQVWSLTLWSTIYEIWIRFVRGSKGVLQN